MGRVSVAPDHVVIMENSEEMLQLYFQAGFLPDFPQHRLLVGFIHFDQAADQSPLSVVRPALEQDSVLPGDDRACAVQDEFARAGDFPQFMYIVHTDPTFRIILYCMKDVCPDMPGKA